MRRWASIASVLGSCLLLVACPFVESPPLPPLASVVPGPGHSLALDEAGHGWAWGHDWDGQLGVGGSVFPKHRVLPTAVRMPRGVRFTRLAAASSHSLALDQEGNAWAWGSNLLGQLGDGTTRDGRTTPVRVAAPAGVVFTAIAATASYSLALDQHGAAWAWGANDDGWPDDGAWVRRAPALVSVPVGVTFASVAAGGGAMATFSLALDQAGNAWAWGRNTCGQLGDGSFEPQDAPAPVTMPADASFTMLSAGADHVLALDEDGNAWAWGCNDALQLGHDDVARHPEPVAVTMPEGVSLVSVSAGEQSSLALDDLGRAWQWGRIYQDGPAGTTVDTTGTPVLVDVPTGVGFVAAAATGHVLALDGEGTAWSWGNNLFGQLGDGSLFPRGTPARVGR